MLLQNLLNFLNVNYLKPRQQFVSFDLIHLQSDIKQRNSRIAGNKKIYRIWYPQMTPTLDEDLCLDSCSLYFSISSSARFSRTSVALWEVVCCFCCRFNCSNSCEIFTSISLKLVYNVSILSD